MYELSNYTPRVLQSRSAWYSHSLFKSHQVCPSIPSMATCRHFLRKILSKCYVFFVSSRLLERHRRVFYNFWKMVWPLDYWRRSVLNTGCNRRNGPDFGRVFLRSNYTDITRKTYIQSSMVTEILAREVWNFDSYYSLIEYQIHIETGRNMWFL